MDGQTKKGAAIMDETTIETFDDPVVEAYWKDKGYLRGGEDYQVCCIGEGMYEQISI